MIKHLLLLHYKFIFNCYLDSRWYFLTGNLNLFYNCASFANGENEKWTDLPKVIWQVYDKTESSFRTPNLRPGLYPVPLIMINCYHHRHHHQCWYYCLSSVVVPRSSCKSELSSAGALQIYTMPGEFSVHPSPNRAIYWCLGYRRALINSLWCPWRMTALTYLFLNCLPSRQDESLS